MTTYAEVLEQVLGLAVDLEKAALLVGGVEGGDLGDVLILALTLLLLKLEGDTTDGTALNALHQMRGVTGNLVAEALGGNDGNFIADALVGLEVEGQAGVVTLNDDLGGLLDGLGADATHFGGVVWLLGERVLIEVVVGSLESFRAALTKFRPSGNLVVNVISGALPELRATGEGHLLHHVDWPLIIN